MEKRKNAKLVFPLAALAMLLVLLSLLIFEQATQKDYFASSANFTDISQPTLTVSFIDVGQGDCILITCENEAMLIDAGDNGTEQTVINYIRSSGIARLDYVVLTHPHADHMGGMPEVLREFGVGTVVMPRISEELTPTNNTYDDFLSALEGSSAKKLYAAVGMTMDIGSAHFTIIAPISEDADDLNDMSIVMRMDYGEVSCLFTGDASQAEESDILAGAADIDCDILKVGHHGSAASSNMDFLTAVSPEAAFIMCGEDNNYNHPAKKTLKRLYKFTESVYRTDICGTVVITCTPQGYAVDY